MLYEVITMSAFSNGVSAKHGEVAREMWHFLWPEAKLEDVPIGSITNGVHVPTWMNPRLIQLINRYLSQICPDWLDHHDKDYVWALIDRIPDAKLWELHYGLKIKLVITSYSIHYTKLYEKSGGKSLKDSVQEIAFEHGLPRSAVYKTALKIWHNN